MTSADGIRQDAAADKARSEELERDLLAVANTRDLQAFKRLFANFAPRLKFFLVKRGMTENTAEDVMQETMLKVWRKAMLFDGTKASASTWIYTIARNVRIDRLRKELRPEPDPNDPCFVPDDPETGEQAMSRKQDRERIRKAMSVLPPDQMTIIKMSFFEEKSHGEISSELNIPLGTVKSRMRLAFGKIRAELEVTS
ncbi:sigma-70 family RNA polymerase sigma factor [Sneathiella chungangensis]|uniref:Sigma-70 family RNA polymerase sigma factor n=1 Tax=Sneathiella chungangensis TaxID=1418234 RepID=A0A845MGF8_9PROT|nr:sigma-70 family RNA polymerase sigma factor [Sneathiella chungangensis]MZR22899.1 sigma-70 family RNA polymerase sigma factor [Sneathiella chungangensis]